MGTPVDDPSNTAAAAEKLSRRNSGGLDNDNNMPGGRHGGNHSLYRQSCTDMTHVPGIMSHRPVGK